MELHDTQGRASLGRVHAVDEDALEVVLPFDAALTAGIGEGATVHVTWSVPGGVALLSTSVAERTGAAQIEIWRLTPLGPARFDQRRQEHRVSMNEPVLVTVYPNLGPRPLPETRDDPSPLTGTIIDLSPSAAQCVVSADLDDPVMHSDTQVTCEFTLADRRLALRGSVLTAWTSADSSLVRVVVQFDAGQPDLAVVVDFIGSVDS